MNQFEWWLRGSHCNSSQLCAVYSTSAGGKCHMPVSVPSVWPAVADMKSIVEHSRLFLNLVDSRRSRARSPPLPALTVLPTLLHPPTIVGRGYVSVLFVRLCVWLFVCQQDYCKSNRPISRKLGIIVGPTNPKNWLYYLKPDHHQ